MISNAKIYDISCKDVSIKYDGDRAVSNVSFDLRRGECLCILGENGSGKSTLIKGILGILPINSGSVNIYCSRSDIGYVQQQTTIQRDFPASVKEIAMSGFYARRRLRITASAQEKVVFDKYAHQLGISRLVHKPFGELSGGQQQRVLLLRALCAARSLLVLDEPTASLDPSAVSETYAILKNIISNESISVLLVSHDTKNALTLADSVIHIKTSPLFYGSAADYKRTGLYAKAVGVHTDD